MHLRLSESEEIQEGGKKAFGHLVGISKSIWYKKPRARGTKDRGPAVAVWPTGKVKEGVIGGLSL